VDQIAKPGETKASKLHESRIGGKGANQAVAIARAGGLVQFYGTIGKDGVWIKEQLKEHGIDVSAILVAEVWFPSPFFELAAVPGLGLTDKPGF
jgi:ribokinase